MQKIKAACEGGFWVFLVIRVALANADGMPVH
jgi:hypothetical protein